MPRSTHVSPVVLRQLRDRLEEECKIRGRAVAIAQATGISSAHISRVVNGKAELGEVFAHALVKIWNLDEDVLKQDGKAGVRSSTPALPPNLQATLAFLEGSYPRDFFSHIRRQARALGTDQRRPEWVAWVEARFWEWKQKNRPEPERSGTFSWEEEHATPNVGGRKRRVGR